MVLGIAQLLTVALQHQDKDTFNDKEEESLPPETKLRTLSFGCPPVFTSPHLVSMHNILDVLHHNDGISGISLRGLSKLHQRKRGLAKMKLHRRTLFRMALGKKNKTDGALSVPEEEDLQNIGEDLDGQEDLLSDEQEDVGGVEDNEGLKDPPIEKGNERNEGRTHSENESHKPAKQTKDDFKPEAEVQTEEVDDVDGEAVRPRRQSLLAQMATTLNIDPNHPSQPSINAILSQRDPGPSSTLEKEPKGEDINGGKNSGIKRKESSLSESFLASLASLRSEPVTPGETLFLFAITMVHHQHRPGLWSRVEGFLSDLPDSPYPKVCRQNQGPTNRSNTLQPAIRCPLFTDWQAW